MVVMPTRTPTQILTECAREARKRDNLDPKLKAVNARLRELWNEGREAGVEGWELAEKSGVSAGTIRMYWDPVKVAQRAKVRKVMKRRKGARATPEERSEIARKAANARWANSRVQYRGRTKRKALDGAA